MYTVASIIVGILNPLFVAYLEQYYWSEKQILGSSVLLAFVTQLVLTGLLHLFTGDPLIINEPTILQYLQLSFMMVGVQSVAGLYWSTQPSVQALKMSNNKEHDL